VAWDKSKGGTNIDKAELYDPGGVHVRLPLRGCCADVWTELAEPARKFCSSWRTSARTEPDDGTRSSDPLRAISILSLANDLAEQKCAISLGHRAVTVSTEELVCGRSAARPRPAPTPAKDDEDSPMSTVEVLSGAAPLNGMGTKDGESAWRLVSALRVNSCSRRFNSSSMDSRLSASSARSTSI